MKFHGNPVAVPVAVLDLESDQVRLFEKSDEGKDFVAVPIPRLKSNVPIYIPRTKDTKGELIAEVNLWNMGVRYNLRRLLGDGTQLYVMNGG